MLQATGRQPAKKVFHTIVDDFEDVLVTHDPIGVPPKSARIAEMSELLRESLSTELWAALHSGGIAEVEDLELLGRRAQKHLGKCFCEGVLREASAFLLARGVTRRAQIRRLLGFCDRETLVWLGIGLFIKILSQMPGPLRMLYVSATVTAASRGLEGLVDFHAAAATSVWLFAMEKLLQFAGRITMFRGEQLFTLRLKKEVYAACLRQDMEFFDSHRCGELQTRLNSDTQEVCQKVLYYPVRFVQFSFFLIFNVVTLLTANPRLVIATLSILPLSLFGNVCLMKRLHKFYAKMQRRAEVSASKTQEVLSNIRTVRSFAREPRELQRYMRDQEYEARVLSQVNLLQGMTQPFIHAISEMSFFVGLYYGGLLISQGLLAPGEVITLVQGTQACTSVLTDLFDTLPEIAKAGKPASRICELLERPSVIEASAFVEQLSAASLVTSGAFAPEVSPSARAARSVGFVEFDDVHFAYPSRKDIKVLQGLSFTATGGEVVALVGATGCGKSTIMYLLLRFYNPSSGRITLDGRAIDSYNVHWLRRQIGVVPQEPMLFGTSIRENLLYGAGAPAGAGAAVDDERLREMCLLAHAWEFIEKLPEGLSTEVGERGVQLSGGQKQRLAIARAVLTRPKVLLLDEATSALDVNSEQVVQRALDEVIRASSCTTIVIAHRLATVQNASKIVVLADGQVREVGPPRELAALPGGIYARMLRLPDVAGGAGGAAMVNGNCAAIANGEGVNGVEKCNGHSRNQTDKCNGCVLNGAEPHVAEVELRWRGARNEATQVSRVGA